MLEMSRGQVCLPLLAAILLVGAPLRAQEPSPSEPKPPESIPVESEREERKEEEGDTDTGVDESELDETIVEYDEAGATAKVTDAQGNEITGVVVSKELANQVQDPNALEPGADKSTGVRGRVVSRQPKKVLEDAPVVAKGDDGNVRTSLSDARGAYQLYLPPGRYTLRSYYDFYNGARWDDILVKRGEWKTVNFVLSPITVDDSGVEELEVAYLADTSSEKAQLNIRKESVAIQDAVSAQEISRSGDSDAAGAAKRVVGVLIDEDGRIIIRGLQPRYQQVRLNNMYVPSAEPDVPGVRLDTFPTDIISSISVDKVANPEIPGAFAGGVVNISTERYPFEFLLKAGASLGVNTMSTFKTRPGYEGGHLDWLGYDDGARAMPDAVRDSALNTPTTGRETSFPTTADVLAESAKFRNQWNPVRETSIPVIGANFAVGDTVRLRKRREFGYAAAVTYDYKQSRRRGYRHDFRPSPDGSGGVADKPALELDFERGKEEATLGVFGTTNVQFNSHTRIASTFVYTNASEDETIQASGTNDSLEDGGTEARRSFDFLRRSLVLGQLRGEHQGLGKRSLRVRWNAFGGTSSRYQPDRRFIRLINNNPGSGAPDTITTAQRFYSNLSQFAVGGALDLRTPLWQRAYLTLGSEATYQPREFSVRRFGYTPPSGENRPPSGDPEVALGPAGLGTQSYLRDQTQSADSYDGIESLVAGFAKLEAQLTSELRIIGGARVEIFRQEVIGVQRAIGIDPPRPENDVRRTDINPLPSVVLAYQLPRSMNVKGAYSMTVNRPALRELSPSTYTDFIRSWVISGNPGLKTAQIQNAEVRWEWYPGDTNLIAATAFYKYFANPIEFVVSSVDNRGATYQNAHYAHVAGGELELRYGLGSFTDRLKKFAVAANTTLLYSQAYLATEQNAGLAHRKMYNQPPFVTNLSLIYDDPDSGVLVNVVYNVVGPRIVEAATRTGNSSSGGQTANFPDVYVQPFHDLRLIASWKPTEHVKLSFKWKNMLFDTWDLKQFGRITQRQYIGADVSLGVEYQY